MKNDNLKLAVPITTLSELMTVLNEVKASPKRAAEILHVATIGLESRDVELALYGIKIDFRNPLEKKVEQWVQQVIDIRTL